MTPQEVRAIMDARMAALSAPAGLTIGRSMARAVP
jgi:hypothetical protein